jgi:hypothetical protein
VLDFCGSSNSCTFSELWVKYSLYFAHYPIKFDIKKKDFVWYGMLYGTECWAVKIQHKNQVSVAEMRMLR